MGLSDFRPPRRRHRHPGRRYQQSSRSESYANFTGGQYASWNIKGNVIIQVTETGTIYAVVSGLFFN